VQQLLAQAGRLGGGEAVQPDAGVVLAVRLAGAVTSTVRTRSLGTVSRRRRSSPLRTWTCSSVIR
jgi:hypothetical protein